MTHAALNQVVGRLRSRAKVQGYAVLTDGDLLERYLASRDESAFEALVQRHGPMVLAVCRRVSDNAEDAEDAFQATFLVLVRKAASIRPRHKVGNWLCGVAYRAGMKARAMTHRRRTREKQIPAATQPAAIGSGLWDELLPKLDAELNALPEKFRLPIVLCDLEGKTRKEAAETLEWPEGTVAGRLAQGRAMLAKRLIKNGLPISAGVLVGLLAQNAASASLPPALSSGLVNALAGSMASPRILVISAKVAAIADGVLKTMLISKLRSMLAISVLLTALSFAVAYSTQGNRSEAVGVPIVSAKQTPVKADKVLWGDPVDGLQMGIRFEPSENTKEAKGLEGKWVLTGGHANGQDLPEGARGHVRLIVLADEMILYTDSGRSSRFVHKLNSEATPNQVDLVGIDGADKGKNLLGIYERKEDRLNVCRTLNANTERPKKFSAEAGSKCVIEEWQRDKDEFTLAEDRLRLAGRWRVAEKSADAKSSLRDLDLAEPLFKVTYQDGEQQLGLESGTWRVEEAGGDRKITGPSGGCTYKFDKDQLQLEFTEGRFKGTWTLKKTRMP